MTIITNMTNPSPVINKIENLGLIEFSEIGDSEDSKIKFHEIPNYGKIFVNGNWLGLHSDLKSLLDKLKEYRRMSIIHHYHGILIRMSYIFIQMEEDAHVHYILLIIMN